MGNRLSKIYTRTGDNGTTGMADGSRVTKDSLRMHAIGEVDELNSMIGVVIHKSKPGEIKENMVTIQHDLFNLGGQLAMPDYAMINKQRIEWLEVTLDEMNAQLEHLKNLYCQAVLKTPVFVIWHELFVDVASVRWFL